MHVIVDARSLSLSAFLIVVFVSMIITRSSGLTSIVLRERRNTTPTRCWTVGNKISTPPVLAYALSARHRHQRHHICCLLHRAIVHEMFHHDTTHMLRARNEQFDRMPHILIDNNVSGRRCRIDARRLHRAFSAFIEPNCRIAFHLDNVEFSTQLQVDHCGADSSVCEQHHVTMRDILFALPSSQSHHKVCNPNIRWLTCAHTHTRVI